MKLNNETVSIELKNGTVVQGTITKAVAYYKELLFLQMLNMLRLWRLRRVSSLFARLEKDIRFNYFWTRCTKLVSMTLFAMHCAGCFNYLVVERYPDPTKTWIGAVTPIVQRVHLFARVSYDLLLQMVRISASETREEVGTFALAYAAHKAASPIRFPPMVALTPIVTSWIGKKPKLVIGAV